MLGWNSKGSLPIAAGGPAPSPALPVGTRTMQGGTTGSQVSALRTPWERWQTPALALADQAVVSGASFLTTVLISYWTTPSLLGIYTIGISVLVSMLAIQGSLISLPYTIQRHQPLSTPNEHAGSSLAHCGLLSTLGVVVLAVTALILSARGSGPELMATAWMLAAVAPFALLREFGRRFAFAHLNMGRALMLDMAVAAIQLLALCWLGWTGRMSAANAYAAIGGACALTGIVWLYLARTNFVIRAHQVRATMKQSWCLGKWLRPPDNRVGASMYPLLAVGVGRWHDGHRCLRRVHEHRVVREPSDDRDRQYHGSKGRFGLEGRGLREAASRGHSGIRCC